MAGKHIKVGAHLAMAVMAGTEAKLFNNRFHKLLAGCCCGYHLIAAVIDWRDDHGH